MTSDIDKARQLLVSVPLFEGQDHQSFSIVRLGGLTNLVFRVVTDNGAFCLRIPGVGTTEYIDRQVEEHNARVAARAGVSPKVLHFDGETGLMVTEYIAADTMTPDTFASKPGAIARAARALKQLHSSGETFQFRFELFAMIDNYLRVLDSLDAKLPDGYPDVVSDATSIRQALNASPIPLAPCHCDPVSENFLDDDQKTWIIDWEYSGMNDPLWDLGDLSVEADLSPEREQEMMSAYFDGSFTDAQAGRVVVYKAMSDLLWTLWGLIQHANQNPVDDFWKYATGRFERCKALMGSKDFSNHVEAVRQNR